MFAIEEDVLWVLDILCKNHKEAYLVGGCVRDMIMKRTCHDFDLTTNATPDEVTTIFTNAGYKTIPTGIKHGTISIITQKRLIEITTYRTEETYLDHRKPQSVTFTPNIREDLARRDFSMNAIAYHPSQGFIDPYHGQDDIQRGVIRCIGHAKDRLSEDALRILRALRFATTLSFRIDEECKQAIQELAFELKHISKERITSEFHKILLANHPNTLLFLKEYGVLDYIIPNYTSLYGHQQLTPWHLYDIFTHTDIALNHTKNYPLESKIAIIFHDIGKPRKETFDEQGIAHYKQHALVSQDMAYAYMKHMHYDQKTITRVCTLILYHDYYVIPKRSVLRKFLTKFEQDFAFAQQALDVQLADDFAKNPAKAKEKIDQLYACKKLLEVMEEEQDSLSLKELAVNGHDLLSIGIKGKAIGETLQYLLNQIIENPALNKKEILLPLSETYIQSTLT